MRGKSFTLTHDQIALLDYHANQSPFKSNSEFLGWLIDSFDANSEPHKELQVLEDNERNLLRKVDEIKKNREGVLRRIEAHKDKEKHKEEMVERALDILRRKIMEGDSTDELLRIARVHSLRLKTDPYELLFRAGKTIVKERRL